MKIQFLRLGHANNSSSSHSIIFNSKAKDMSNENQEFGWGRFICASKGDKACYAYAFLVESIRRKLDFSYNHEYFRGDGEILSYDKISKFTNKMVVDLVKKKFAWLWDIIEEGNLEDSAKNASIDHQSGIGLPDNRLTGIIDFVFVEKFLREFIENDWVILGGNDNEDENDYGLANENESSDFLKVWKQLKDSGDSQTMYDDKTGEWWISMDRGPLMRVKF